MRDWEGRVKHWMFQIQNWYLAQWCSEGFHYNLLLSAAQIFFISCAKIQFSVLLLLFQELTGLALQVVSVVAWCYWCTCRRQVPCFCPSHSPFSPRGFCLRLICFKSALSMPLLTTLVFQLKFLMKMDFCWDDKPWMVASEACTCAACTRPPTHLAAVGAVTAQTASAACLVNVNWCRAAWFLSSVDSAGLSLVCASSTEYLLLSNCSV